MNLPYVDTIISIFQILIGIYAFTVSFRTKHFKLLSSNLSPKFAKIAKPLYRFVGVAFVIIGVISLTSHNYIKVNNAEDHEIISKFGNKNKIELLQNNAGVKQKSGWFKGIGGEDTYTVLFPKLFKEYKIPTENNKCIAYYSASCISNNIEYLVEYIVYKDLEPNLLKNALLSTKDPNIINIVEKKHESHPMFEIKYKTPTGVDFTQAIYTQTSQYSLTVRSKTGGDIDTKAKEIFFNSFKILTRK